MLLKKIQDKTFFLTHAYPYSLRILLENIFPKRVLDHFYWLTNPGIPDRKDYIPYFLPWIADPEFTALRASVHGRSLLIRETMWTLYTLAQQCLHLPGDFAEAGVYKGGTARFLKLLMDKQPGKTLHLFDTFEGMPKTDRGIDLHKEGDFADTSLTSVRAFVGSQGVAYHQGWMPQTFAGLEDRMFAFAHIDVDILDSVRDCCEFFYPRMSAGAVMVFDDYGLATCPGARAGVDAFFRDKPERPLALAHGQAIVIKLPAAAVAHA